jgi:hypothetical protein
MVTPYVLPTLPHCLLSFGAWAKFLPGDLFKGK